MSRLRTLRAGSLCIVVATYAASWGCTEGFSAAPGLGPDASSSGDASPPGDAMDAEPASDGPTRDARSDASAMDDHDAGDASPAIDASLPPDAADGADATVDGNDVLGASDAADAPDAANAPDALLTPSLRASNNVSLNATCNGALGTTPQSPASVTLTNRTPYAFTWSATATHGSVTAQPNSGTMGVGGFTAPMISAVPLSTYPPGPVLDDTLVVTTNDGRPALVIPVTETFLGYHADTSPIAFGLVPTGTSATQQVAVTFNGLCCMSASPDAVIGPFSAVSTRSAGVVTNIAITFSPTAATTSSASFQFAGTLVQVCSPPIMVSGTGN
jgi:hypothetical protein